MSVVTPKAAGKAAMDLVNHCLAQPPARLRWWNLECEVDGEAVSLSVVVMSQADREQLAAIHASGMVFSFEPAPAEPTSTEPTAEPAAEPDEAPAPAEAS